MRPDSIAVGRRHVVIQVGERAPDFALPTSDEGTTRFYGQVGGSASVLVFAGVDAAQGARIAERLREVCSSPTTVHMVSSAPPWDEGTSFRDPEAMVHRAYGIDPEDGPVALVLDANVRVVTGLRLDDDASGLAEVTDTARGLDPTGSDAVVQRHAPVLLVPGAMTEELCDRVIAHWEAADPVVTGVETTADGRRVEALDSLRKRRRDHVVTDGALMRELTSHVGRRVIPEITKAFAYEASRFEGFKIGCYADTDEGFFAAHRDNLSAATAHRRFALSLNLNSPDEYEGGGLRFPEYGPDRYRPQRGEALVFSGSHLHEVRPVTRGRRFVLLSFLYGKK